MNKNEINKTIKYHKSLIKIGGWVKWMDKNARMKKKRKEIKIYSKKSHKNWSILSHIKSPKILSFLIR
jgi:hypothetical protein